MYILNRVLKGILLIWVTSVIVFLIICFIPGNGIEGNISPNASKEKIQTQVKYYGLDQSIFKRYISFSSKLIKGDLGYSFSFKMPVTKVIARHLYPTFLIGILALLFEFLFAVPLGIMGSYSKKWSKAGDIICLISVSVPIFFVGLLLKNILSLKLMILPMGGMGANNFADRFIHLLLPSFILGFSGVGIVIKYVKTFMGEALHQDYVLLAKAKGLSKKQIVLRHCAKNIMMPLSTLFFSSLPIIFYGAYIVEILFGINGMGSLAVKGFMARDYNLIMAYTIVLSIIIVASNIVSDLLFSFLDKRVKAGEGV